jgi:hypothetical protein
MLPRSTLKDPTSKPIDRSLLLVAIASILAMGGGVTAYLRWRSSIFVPAQTPITIPLNHFSRQKIKQTQTRIKFSDYN